MGLPEILSSPALAVLVSVSLLWTVSRLRVSSFLLLAEVSIASAVSGTTSTFIFDFSSFNFFW